MHTLDILGSVCGPFNIFYLENVPGASNTPAGSVRDHVLKAFHWALDVVGSVGPQCYRSEQVAVALRRCKGVIGPWEPLPISRMMVVANVAK